MEVGHRAALGPLCAEGVGQLRQRVGPHRRDARVGAVGGRGGAARDPIGGRVGGKVEVAAPDAEALGGRGRLEQRRQVARDHDLLPGRVVGHVDGREVDLVAKPVLEAGEAAVATRQVGFSDVAAIHDVAAI